MTVHVLHENEAWLAPFGRALDARGVPWEAWALDEGTLDLDAEPPAGVFWSRMSASAHTRGHDRAKEHTRAVLSWLEAAGRRVVNGRRVLELELSKVDQLTALRAAGIATPRTIAVVGTGGLAAAARRLPAPFVVKPNQGGTGHGVRRFDDHEAFAAHLADGFEPPVDGITLLQEYVVAREPSITRAEFVDGEFVYALRADTTGGFELCPADACALPGGGTLFAHRPDVDAALIRRYRRFLAAHGIEVAGIEYIERADGEVLTYDVNTNTNYNPEVERAAGRSGPEAVAAFLARLHDAECDHAPAA